METTKIDFVPAENALAHAKSVSNWLKANAFMGLKDGSHNIHDLDTFEGGHLYLTLGGDFPNKDRPGTTVSIEASFTVAWPRYTANEVVYEDPEGTHWTCSNVHAEVGWYSTSSAPVNNAKMRASIINGAIELAERFDAEFVGVTVWWKGSTVAERAAAEKAREEQAEVRRQATRKVLVAAAIQTAIHTTCKNMRVGNERSALGPVDVPPGKYHVVVENKEYEAHVFTGRSNMRFRRTA